MVSSSNGASKRYRGVRQRQWGSWVSEIRHSISKTRIWLGTFNTAKKAAKAYDEAARIMEGANAKTNFPLSSSSSSSSLLSPSVKAKLMHCNCMSSLRGPSNKYNTLSNNLSAVQMRHMNAATKDHTIKFKAAKVTNCIHNQNNKNAHDHDGCRTFHGSSMGAYSSGVCMHGIDDGPRASSQWAGRSSSGTRTLASKPNYGQNRTQTLVCLRLDDAEDRLGVMWQGSSPDSKPRWVTTIHVPPLASSATPATISAHVVTSTAYATNQILSSKMPGCMAQLDHPAAGPDGASSPMHTPSSSTTCSTVMTTSANMSSGCAMSTADGTMADTLLDLVQFDDVPGRLNPQPAILHNIPNVPLPTPNSFNNANACRIDDLHAVTTMDLESTSSSIDLIDLIYGSTHHDLQLMATSYTSSSSNVDHHQVHNNIHDGMALMESLQLDAQLAEASISQALLYLAQAEGGKAEEDDQYGGSNSLNAIPFNHHVSDEDASSSSYTYPEGIPCLYGEGEEDEHGNGMIHDDDDHHEQSMSMSCFPFLLDYSMSISSHEEELWQ